jgi:hypothetical protein
MNNTPITKENLQKRLDALLEKKNKLVELYGAKKWKSANPKLQKETSYIARNILLLRIRINNPDKWKSRNKGKDQKKNTVGRQVSASGRSRGYDHDEPKFINKWFNEQKQICTYCNCNVDEVNSYLEKTKISVKNKRMSVDRVDNNKGYILGNLTLSCFICNTHKKDFFSHEDFLKIAKKYIRPKIICSTQSLKN